MEPGIETNIAIMENSMEVPKNEKTIYVALNMLQCM